MLQESHMFPKHPPFTLSTQLIFFIPLLYSFVFSSQQGCNEQDQFALLDFSRGISTSFSSPSLNWSSSINCCNWEGVDCDINGRVIHLQLSSRGLRGSLREELVRLTNLRTIDLSLNEIFGFIPQDIGKLLYLKKLYLHGNNLSGSIPLSLKNCTNIEEVILRDNHFDGDISKLDFLRLLKLQKLDLRNNSLNGSLPTSIYSCKSLVAIAISHNFMNGQISSKIVELKSLSFLSLAQNSFTNIKGTLRVLAKCKNLTTLFLSSNFFGESLPIHRNFIRIGEFPKLQFLNLRYCIFASGPIPNWLSNLRSLRALDMEGSRLTGRVPTLLGTLPNLFRLILDNNRLYGEFPLSLCQLPALISQTIQEDPKLVQFELPVYHDIGHSYIWLKTGNYYGIGLSHNSFSGSIPKEIGNLRNLQKLYLNNNQFSGPIPNSMSNLEKLVKLNLSRNNLTGEIPKSLKSLSFLSLFDVSYNDLRGPIPNGGQLSTFEESNFEGNPGLCGPPLQNLCSDPPTSRETKRNTGSHSHQFLDGLLCGFASGFSGILLVVVSYVCYKRYVQ